MFVYRNSSHRTYLWILALMINFRCSISEPDLKYFPHFYYLQCCGVAGSERSTNQHFALVQFIRPAGSHDFNHYHFPSHWSILYNLYVFPEISSVPSHTLKIKHKGTKDIFQYIDTHSITWALPIFSLDLDFLQVLICPILTGLWQSTLSLSCTLVLISTC